MTLRTLIRRSLRHHWRAHLGVVLGAAIGSAALIGALVVGDSVKGSLRERVLERFGNVSVVLKTDDRLFAGGLDDRMWGVTSNRARGYDPDRESPYFAGRVNGAIEFLTGGTVTLSGRRELLQLPGSIAQANGSSRVNQISVVGTGNGFFYWQEPLWKKLAADGAITTQQYPTIESGETWLNFELARRLNVQSGDVVILRVPKRAAFNRESAISPRSEQLASLRLTVAGVLPPRLGDFSLQASPQPPLNAFVNPAQLWEATGTSNQFNMLWVQARKFQPYSLMRAFSRQWEDWRVGWGENPLTHFRWFRIARNIQGGMFASDVEPHEAVTLASNVLSRVWNLGAIEYELQQPEKQTAALELRTKRVFLDPPIARASYAADTNAQPLLTYLATLLYAGTNATPYSMVTAAGAPWTPADLRDDEIVVSQWLADDLHVKPGDEIALSYFLPESGARLIEATNTFRVRSIAPAEMPWADRTLMPDFPGIEKAESTSEWDAGFPLTYKVREKDDAYWKKFRGTPKAFITLAAGQKMWGNRFGNLTAIRFPIPTSATTALTPALSPGERENHSPSPGESKAGVGTTRTEQSAIGQRLSPLPAGEGQGEGERISANLDAYRAALEKKILANLKPEELGLRFEPVREQALKAAEESQDFGGLFLGFSFFVIAAALLLMVLLLSLGLEQRAPEIGTLLALGFTPQQVRKLLLREAVVLSLIGGVIGALGGLAYAKLMLHGLTTVWRDAVGATALNFHYTGQTLAIGIFASTAVSVITIWLALRKFVKRPARELLVGEVGVEESKVQSLKSKVIAVGASLAAVAMVGWAMTTGATANAEIFFGAGALVLVAGLSWVGEWLARRIGVAPVADAKHSPQNGDRRDAGPTFASLALHGCARRRKRSLATIAMLACGSFLIVSIGVFRLDANRDATKQSSGTGGFALIGETTMPVVHDLNTSAGRDFFALNDADVKDVNFVPFRVRAGDEASCLNLNAAQRPRLLGVKPEMLEGRFGFTKNLNEMTKIGPWSSLERLHLSVALDKEEIPAIGDANSIQWAMHKKVGDTIDYVDERGQPFKVRIVGAVANSILQGQLIIDEAEFVKRFPGESGYRMFLIDAPSNAVVQVSAALSRAMQDVGLELTPAAQRLAQFNAVQNTYLGTFQVLGGLGLLLGSVGLGIVVLRNVLERRGELALLLAVGFRKPQVQRLLLLENGAVLAAGLALGVLAAAVAVLPALLSPSAELPYASLAVTLGAVLTNGALWTWAATRLAVRGDLLGALRNE